MRSEIYAGVFRVHFSGQKAWARRPCHLIYPTTKLTSFLGT